MQSRFLKIIIGLIYFLIVVIICVMLNRTYFSSGLRRLIICYNFAFLGLGIRAFLYYGFLRKEPTKKLNKVEIGNCIFDYILYGLKSLVVYSFIYLIFYNNFIEMGKGTFFLISGFLFTYGGFAILEFAKRFLKIEV